MRESTSISGWRDIALEEAVLIQTGFAKGSIKPNGSPTVKRPYLRAANVQDGYLELSNIAQIELPNGVGDRCTLRSGDVLIVEASGNAEKVGCGWKWSGEVDNCLHQNHVFALRPNHALLLSDYLALIITTDRWKANFQQGSTKSTTLASINTKQIKEVKLAIPPVVEQRAICDVLARWTDGVQRAATLLKLKRRLKRGLMQQLLTGHKRFPEFTGRPWREVQIGEMLREVNRTSTLDSKAPYRLVSIRRRSGGFFDREVRLGHQIGYPTLEQIHAGDFVIARRQVVHGAMATVPVEFHGAFVSNAYAILEAHDPNEFHVPYFNFVSQQPHLYHLAFRCSYGVAIEKMFFRLDWFLKERIHVPPTLVEQKKITNVLTTADREIALLEQQLAALREQKNGLMQKLLTGQVRLKRSKVKS